MGIVFPKSYTSPSIIVKLLQSRGLSVTRLVGFRKEVIESSHRFMNNEELPTSLRQKVDRNVKNLTQILILK